MMNRNQQNNRAISSYDVLGLMLIYLKLTGEINWGWFFVLAPAFIPIVFEVVISIVPLVVRVIAARRTRNK